jgi:hypothetical protein
MSNGHALWRVAALLKISQIPSFTTDFRLHALGKLQAGFEKVELSVPATALQMAGTNVDIVSMHAGRIRGVNLHEPAGKVPVTKTLAEAHPSDSGRCPPFRPYRAGNPGTRRRIGCDRDLRRMFAPHLRMRQPPRLHAPHRTG